MDKCNASVALISRINKVYLEGGFSAVDMSFFFTWECNNNRTLHAENALRNEEWKS